MASTHSRRALGRGLTTLIPIDSEEKGSDNEIVLVDSNAIRPNPFQPRQEFDAEEIKGLAESIKTQGLLQAIILRKKNDGYEIISGERRVRALKVLGYDKIPSIIKPKVSDREMIEMALVENIQREDLNEIETGLAFQRLLLECGLSHEELSKRVGKSRSAITNTLRLLKLPENIRLLVTRGDISMGHARALLAVEDPEKQMELGERIVSQELSVRDIEAAVQRLKEKKQQSKQSSKKKGDLPRDPDLLELIEKIQYRFGTKANIISLRDNKGKIEIHFFNKEDLNRIIDLLIKS
jgi:ParB family transcriptional regulator, chromosome partitioning protein